MLVSAQQNCTTSEKELLSIVETLLKEFHSILLEYKIEVFMDHKKLTYEKEESYNAGEVSCKNMISISNILREKLLSLLTQSVPYPNNFGESFSEIRLAIMPKST